MATTLRPLLIRTGREFFHDADKAEDVAQEVLMRLWVMRNRIEAGTSLKPLAVRMAKNVCISTWRHERHTVPIMEGKDVCNGNTEPPPDMDESDNAVMIRRIMARLTDRERRLMRMRNEERMEIGEIAAVTGLDARSVSVMLSRARRKIMELIKKGGDI